MKIGFECRFEPLDASFVVTDSACLQTFRQSDASGLLFVIHGRVDVCLPDGNWEVGAREGLHFHVRGNSKVTFHYGTGAEFYLLRFRLCSSLTANQNLNVPERAPIQNPDRLTDLLRRYIDEEGLEQPSTVILYHLTVLSLCELSSAHTEAVNASQPGLEFIASGTDAYIAAHYRRQISTPEIAHALHYNPAYLERVYRLSRSTSIREAIYRRRINEAKAQLLLHDDLSVARISAMCGFSNANYFRRVFKRVTGMTPNHYRLAAAALPEPELDGMEARR